MLDKNDRERLTTIGQRIRELREAKGMLQTQLADRSGITRQYMSQIEKDGVNLPLNTFVRIAGALGVDANSILLDADFTNAASTSKGRPLTILDAVTGLKEYRDNLSPQAQEIANDLLELIEKAYTGDNLEVWYEKVLYTYIFFVEKTLNDDPKKTAAFSEIKKYLQQAIGTFIQHMKQGLNIDMYKKKRN